MASPIREGTFSSSAFSSRDIDICKEKICLKIDKDFKKAFYRIEYSIETDRNGIQIPLLFIAKDYQGEFKVWVDNQEVKLLEIPSEYRTSVNSPFENFSNHFRQPSQDGESESVIIYWQKNSGNVYNLSELKYFEIDLSKGKHLIRIEYTASVWTDISDWVKEYSFRYSLSPAQNWKSFGALEIILDASNFNSSLTTNLEQYTHGHLDRISVWKFSEIPSDYIEIIYKPEISLLAKTMIAITPFGLTLIFALLIAFIHFLSIKKYRKNKPTKKYSWVVIAGSVTIPFFILLNYIISFDIIDRVIGDEAGNYHGYTFQAIILYPLLLPVYWAIMNLIDKKIKGRIKRSV